MKPFNLEEAKAGKPVCTREGKDVVIIDYNYKCTYDGYDGNILLIGKVIQEDGTEEAVAYYQDGRERMDGHNSRDLFMKTEKHEGWGWLNKWAPRLSPRSIVSMFAQIYETEEEAWAHKPDRCECFLAKVEWEE